MGTSGATVRASMPPSHRQATLSSGGAAPAETASAGRGWTGATFAVVLVAFMLRAWFVWSYRGFPLAGAPVMDERYHLDWARAFSSSQTFVEGPYFRAPLYPWFLGMAMDVFGENLTALRLLQSGLGALATWLVIRIARSLFGHAAGLIAGGLYATLWISVFYDSQLLLESLAIPLYLSALWAALWLWREVRVLPAVATGVCLGLGAICRPNVLLVLPLLALGLILRARTAHASAWPALFALLGGLALPILPITLRNARVGGEAILISSQAGVNLWIGNNPASDGITAIVPGTREDWWGGYYDSIQMAERESGRKLSAGEVSQFYVNKSVAFARQDPRAFLALLGKKLRWFVSDWELPNNEEPLFVARYSAPWMRFLPVGTGLLLAAGLLGLFLQRRAWREHWPLWTFLLAYSASVVLFFVNARYRLPVLPVLAIYAGALGASWLRALNERRRGQVAAGAAILVALVALSKVGTADMRRRGESNGWLILGQAQARAGDAAAAVESLERAIAIDPGAWIAHRALASALIQEQRFVDAEDALRRALKLRPKDVIALESLGDLLLDHNRFGDIEAVAQQLESAGSTAAKAEYLRGRAAHKSGALAAAEAAYARAAELDPADWRSAYALGVLREPKADWQQTRAALEQALRALRAGLGTGTVQESSTRKYLLDLLMRLATAQERAGDPAAAQRTRAELEAAAREPTGKP